MSREVRRPECSVDGSRVLTRSDPSQVRVTPSCFLEKELEGPQAAESITVNVCLREVSVCLEGTFHCP